MGNAVRRFLNAVFARSLSLEGADVAVAKPDLCTIYVWPGTWIGQRCLCFCSSSGGTHFGSVSVKPGLEYCAGQTCQAGVGLILAS